MRKVQSRYGEGVGDTHGELTGLEISPGPTVFVWVGPPWSGWRANWGSVVVRSVCRVCRVRWVHVRVVGRWEGRFLGLLWEESCLNKYHSAPVPRDVLITSLPVLDGYY